MDPEGAVAWLFTVENSLVIFFKIYMHTHIHTQVIFPLFIKELNVHCRYVRNPQKQISLRPTPRWGFHWAQGPGLF